MGKIARWCGLLVLAILVACGGSHDVVSKGPIQKRKYRPGWSVDIGVGHQQREASPKRMTSRAVEARPAEEPIAQTPLQGTGPADRSAEPLAMISDRADPPVIVAPAKSAVTAALPEMIAPPLPDDRPLNKLAPTALAVVVGGVLLSFLIDTGTFFVIGIILGFVLSLIALGQIKRRNESGEGYGIAALVLSTIGMVVLLLALLTYTNGF